MSREDSKIQQKILAMIRRHEAALPRRPKKPKKNTGNTPRQIPKYVAS